MIWKLATAAKKLDISRSLLHRWISEGKIPAIVLATGPRGHRILRIRPEAIERFIADQEKESAAPAVENHRKWDDTAMNDWFDIENTRYHVKQTLLKRLDGLAEHLLQELAVRQSSTFTGDKKTWLSGYFAALLDIIE